MTLNQISNRIRPFLLMGLLAGCLNLLAQPLQAAVSKTEAKGVELRVSFQYMLANFSGPVRSQWARLDFEPDSQEIYTLDTASNRISIFSAQGMEIFSFGDQGDAIRAIDLAVGDKGSIYLLGRNFTDRGVQELNYRGEALTRIIPGELPPDFARVQPGRLEYNDGHLYLVDESQLKIIVMASDGSIRKTYDLSEEFDRISTAKNRDADKAVDTKITGFTVAADGTMYFTAATLFSAFKLNPDGTLRSFGRAGSGPGKFGVVSGIAADRKRIYVADRLRSAVLIFNHDFVFQGEFGYRGRGPEDMVVPDDLALNASERQIYVSQAANKGVGVYKVELITP